MDFNTGNTAFMLVATSLVMFMTPGLAFFYGGLVGKKGVLTIMMQSFVSLGITTILWVTVGYSLCFSGDIGGIIGNLDMAFLRGISIHDSLSPTNNIPVLVFVAYQMMFAVITPALITGAFAERVRFKAYIIFQIAWLLLVYFPFTHMVWGGGILAQWGVLDFAGGIVVHATAGMAALASVFFVGKRQMKATEPHSVPLIAIGTAILWFGWYGFNAGSELRVDSVTALAFLNTDISASFAAIVWLAMEWKTTGKPKFVGLLTGAVAGLATITPAAGFVDMKTAALIGCIASIVCFKAIGLKNKMNWDDALDVWGVHGVGGIAGVVLLGIFGSSAINGSGSDGLIYGGTHFFLVEVGAVAFASIYAFVISYGLLHLIDKITPVRVDAHDQETGLDVVLHGETAYFM
ncbi:ammonium transporter [Fusibacter ferrireducens]|uniref:Ammonium transporter n=1 Tax=Fusibacter ferrireducens TaxID=2785058 RepID=A0ABR9ZRG7_9FIRM|nr:ammonium transporter [Fusibacter ferrireducens]MBF4693055.1 ammonium transporter [Fusibacter ferrireducens]